MGYSRFIHWFASFILSHDHLAGTFRLQNRIKLVDLCYCRYLRYTYCSSDRKLAELEGSYEESGGGAEA